MDPDANLAEQRKIAAMLIEAIDNGRAVNWSVHAGRLAELVIALDNWQTNGGFPPSDWKQQT
jgi:hypothetical protein